ncbi:MAG TPA: hypothetical protein VFS44_08520 [Gemmatimonadaceae bacterium]|nr:hypothetical protein [Gemmatimonadaceae bacterium]
MLLGAAMLSGCGADRSTGVSSIGTESRTLDVSRGTEIDVTLQTIGPGEYASPPIVSSRSVRFLGVSLVTPVVPAGPTQRFRFEAVSSGTAVVVFRHTGNSPVVEDTIFVR